MRPGRLSRHLLGVLFLSMTATGYADITPRIGHASDVGRAHDRDHVLVKVAVDRDADVVLQGSKARHLFARWYRVELGPDESPELALERFSQTAGVAITELEYLISMPPLTGQGVKEADLHAALSPNDPNYGFQWHMPLIEMPAAWDRGRGAGTTVAVVDTGITSLGVDLTCHTFKDPYNAITGQSGPGVAEDDASHGSHVAGTVAQCTDNGIGVTGLADATRLMPVKVLDANGDGSFADAATGIDWAVDRGADVVNMSFGAECDLGWPACSTSILNDVIDRAVTQDVVLVVAAGNQSKAYLSHPANHPDVIPVTAVDLEKNIASYSNFDLALAHSHVIAAPGGDVTVDRNGDGFADGVLQETLQPQGCEVPGSTAPTAYCFVQGTSMATPHVAGAAAILKGLYPEASRDDIMQALEDSAQDLGQPGYDSFYGHGLLQVDQAIDALDDLLGTEPFTCIPGENVLCISAYGDAWEVTIDWETTESMGKSQAVDLSPVGISQGGAMTFFDAANPEVLIKVLDFCTFTPINSYAVFYAATTNVKFTIRVRQASTGYTETYSNPLGVEAPPVQDLATGFTCP